MRCWVRGESRLPMCGRFGLSLDKRQADICIRARFLDMLYRYGDLRD